MEIDRPVILLRPHDEARSSNAALSSDQGLLLGLMLDSRLRLLVGLEVLLRSSREVALLNSGLGMGDLGGRGAATEHLLGLGGVVTKVLLGDIGSVGGVVASNLAKLLGLGVNEVLGVLEVVVNELLVGGVDQGHGEEESGSEEGETPVGDDLDQPVREESADANLVAYSG